MTISEWLDKKESEGFNVAQMELPDDLSYDEDPEEAVFFREINPCGLLCTGNHPLSTVERFGKWYVCHGQDKKAGIHATGKEWRFITKDRNLAVKMAESHIE